MAAFAGHTHQVRPYLVLVSHLCKLQTDAADFANGRPLCTQDGYGRDQTGIHYRALSAILETPPGRDCFGFVGKLACCAKLTHCIVGASASALMSRAKARRPYRSACNPIIRAEFASADVYEDRLDLIGLDALDSMVMHFDKQPTSTAAV